jgi:hypothetical protein
MTKNKVIRRSATGGLIFLFLAVVILSFTGSVPGQYEGGIPIPVDPYAPGTRLHVTLTIYDLSVPGLDAGFAAGPFFMRIVKDDQTYAYSGDFSYDPDSENTLSNTLCNCLNQECYLTCDDLTGLCNFNGLTIIPWDGVAAQVEVLHEFLLNRVIPELPELFPPLPSKKKYTVTLRSYSNLVQGGIMQDGDQYFTMLDFVVAVKAVRR